jgi:NADH:ubiquinone oxidoreductase subunit 6 (subunit J)
MDRDLGVALGFWGLGARAVVAAFGIILTQNLLHAVLLLILSFVAMAGLYLTLSADFVAVAQVLIYAGAVGVLIIFAIMLTPTSSRINADTVFFGPGLILGGLVAVVMGYVAFKTPWDTVEGGGFDSTVAAIGDGLTNRWALPFEIASVLLIAAMIGAIVLVRADVPGQVLHPEGGVADEPAMEIAEPRVEGNRALVTSGRTDA